MPTASFQLRLPGRFVYLITRYVVIAGCLLAFAPREASAWSRDGHRVVCRIAWQLLDPARRSEIERLTSNYRDPDGQSINSYWDACTFADEARAKARGSAAWGRFAVFETWHFANVPRTTTRLPSPPCESPCVILAIPAHVDSLRRGTSDASRAEALFFLSHWVGDIHQPLHVGFADDHGGNDVRPIEGGYYSVSSMHALWDVALPAKVLGATSWMEFADQVAREVTPAQTASWIQGTPTDWAQESYNLVTSPKAQYCDWQPVGGAMSCVSRPGSRTLGDQYQQEFGDDVAMRWQQAGVRLAELIRANLPVR